MEGPIPVAAYRFTTDDGREAWCPVSAELLTDAAGDVEAMARSMARESLEELGDSL
jgi:hypothetical protein